MNTGEYVNSASNSEAQPLPDPMEHIRAIEELCTIPQELGDRLRPQITSVMQSFANTLVQLDQHQAVQIYSDAINWSLFKKVGDTLPQGLVFTHINDELTPVFDIRTPYINDTLSTLHTRILDLGLREPLDEVHNHLLNKIPEMKQRVEAHIVASAEYQLLASFDQPQNKSEDSPLSIAWQQIRSGQAEDAVRRQFGVSSGTSLRNDPGAQQALRRKLAQVDSETMPREVRPSSHLDALHRVRAYLTPFVAESFNSRYGASHSNTFKEVFYDPEDLGLSIRSHDPTDDPHELYEFTDNAADSISKKLYVGEDKARYLTSSFLGYAMSNLLDPQETDFKDALNSALESAINDAAIELVYRLTLRSTREFQSLYSPNHEVMFARTPSGGEQVDSNYLANMQYRPLRSETNWQDILSQKSYLASRRELMSSMHRSVGEVKRYEPVAFRTGQRLILFQYGEEAEIPPSAPDEDIIIALHNVAHGEGIPDIPGYTLVSNNRLGRYGFKVNENGDQYADCPVTVDDIGRTILIDLYTRIGTPTLAQRVARADSLTVSELVAMIRQESVYAIPDQVRKAHDYSSEEGDNWQRESTQIKTPDDLAKLVRDGKFFVQCTGSTQIVMQSLESVFGIASVGQINGLSIQSEDAKISGAKHNQPVFVHGGRQYILDATAHANLLKENNPIPESGSVAHTRQVGAKVLRTVLRDEATPQHRKDFEISSKTLQEEVASATASLIERYKIAFQKPTDRKLDLYLRSLHRHDPARLALEGIFRFGNGKIDSEAFAAIVNYISKCCKATPTEKRRLNITQYSNSFLEQLKTATWRIQYVANEAKRINEIVIL